MKQQSDLRAQVDYYKRENSNKYEEIDKLTKQIKDLTLKNDELQSRLRTEFDEKLKDYVSKREQAYEQEKEEMMRIFKEEYNRKLQSYKEQNKDLQHAYKKKEEEIDIIKERISSLQKNKTELEVINKNLDTEIEKLRNDLDILRLNKEEELNKKDIKLNEFKYLYKKKESEYEELYSLHATLTQEIDLYRKILSEAEQDAGYNGHGPFSTAGNNNNNNNDDLYNGQPLRKKRKLTGGEDACYPSTPGIHRAAHHARQLMNNNSSNNHNNNINGDNDMKDNEEDNSNNNNNNNNEKKRKYNNYINEDGLTDEEEEEEQEDDSNNKTPGEAFPLQFSSMDLTNSMLEIQNISENSVNLKVYMVTNKDESSKYQLPNDRILLPNEKLKLYVGSSLNKSLKNLKLSSMDLIWKCDVWSGDEEDVARLYDPNNREIARIEIHPDMLPEKVRNGCIVM
jgi:myosin heavy subunit